MVLKEGDGSDFPFYRMLFDFGIYPYYFVSL